MRRPTETALKSRARALLEAMTARSRWIYAVPRDDGPAAARAVAEAEGLRATEEGAITTWIDAAGAAVLVARDAPDLDVIVLEARGKAAVPLVAKVLDEAGFYAQSTLLGTAFDVRDEEAPSALGTLAYMAVAWDDAWRDLFALHLAAPDAAVRREAAASLVIAASTSGAPAPVRALLEAAAAKEKEADVEGALRAALARL